MRPLSLHESFSSSCSPHGTNAYHWSTSHVGHVLWDDSNSVHATAEKVVSDIGARLCHMYRKCFLGLPSVGYMPRCAFYFRGAGFACGCIRQHARSTYLKTTTGECTHLVLLLCATFFSTLVCSNTRCVGSPSCGE